MQIWPAAPSFDRHTRYSVFRLNCRGNSQDEGLKKKDFRDHGDVSVTT